MSLNPSDDIFFDKQVRRVHTAETVPLSHTSIEVLNHHADLGKTLDVETLRAARAQLVSRSVKPYSVQKKKDVRYWLISDTHKGHSEIQKHTRRPANVDERVERNWRQLVSPQDIIVHCGDLAFGHVNVAEYMASLPGIHILVRGNHDPKTTSWYMRNGFAFACDGLLLGGVWYSHKPAAHLPTGAVVNIHGHLHNTVPRGWREYPHCRLFALEHENYSPRIVSKFLKNSEPGKVRVCGPSLVHKVRRFISNSRG